MSLQVGRLTFELDVATIETFVWSGDQLRVSGWVTRIGDATSAAVAAEILNSYAGAGSDETVIPVVWTDQAGVTGFYHVKSATLSGQNGLAPQGVWGLFLDLERVNGFAAPSCEAILLGGQRASSEVAEVGSPWHAVPAAAVGYETGVLTPNVITVNSESGQVSVFYEATPSTPPHFYNARPAWYVTPASWYAGAASLAVGGRLVVGRQVTNEPAAWTISNGIVRLVCSAGGVLTTELWSGTAWGTPGVWRIGRRVGVSPYTIDPLLTAHTITVLRNDPACVTVRLSYDAAAIIPGSRFVVNVDYSLRRGSSVVEVTLSTSAVGWWGFHTPVVYASLVQGSDSITDGVFIACGTAEFGKVPVAAKSHVVPMWERQFDQWGWGYLNGQTQAFTGKRFAAAQVERVQVVAR